MSCTSWLDSHTSVKIPQRTISDSTADFSNEKRCEGTAGLESRVLFYTSSSLKPGEKKSNVIKPAGSSQLYISSCCCFLLPRALTPWMNSSSWITITKSSILEGITHPKSSVLTITEMKSAVVLTGCCLLCDQEGHLSTLNKLGGPISPPSGSRRIRLTALESCTDPQGSITITITQMCTYTSWLVRDSSNCPRQMVWSCTLYKSARQYQENSTSTINPETWDGFPDGFHLYFLAA